MNETKPGWEGRLLALWLREDEQERMLRAKKARERGKREMSNKLKEAFASLARAHEECASVYSRWARAMAPCSHCPNPATCETHLRDGTIDRHCDDCCWHEQEAAECRAIGKEA